MQRVLANFGFVTLGLLILLLSGSNASSDEKKKGGAKKKNDGIVEDWGKPDDFEKGKFVAFWLWNEDDTWYFRTTGGGEKVSHRFHGKIAVVGGKLIDLKGEKGEYGGGNVDRYIFRKSFIEFDFKTSGGTDGLNFKVSEAATELKFSIAIDGDAKTKHIRVGKAGDHPFEAEFKAPAHPVNKSKK